MDSNNPRAVDVEGITMLLVNEMNSALEYETIPASVAEVPASVMCVIDQRSDLFHQKGEHPLERRPSPPARVCLEKSFLSIFCHSTETPGKPVHAHAEKWSKSDKMSLDGSRQPELIIPKELSCCFTADKDSVMTDLCVVYTDITDQQTSPTLDKAVDKAMLPVKRVHTRAHRSSENWRSRSDVLGTKCDRRMRSHLDLIQRREIHNRKEQDRRRRIRLCCDELNLLVPFCYTDTDKATTLQWTTAFLKYIQEIHGDSLKHNFQSTFCGNTGLRMKPSCVPAVQHSEPCTDTLKPVNSSHN